MRYAQDFLYNQVRAVCDFLCANDAGLEMIDKSCTCKKDTCVHCSYCGLRIVGGTGIACLRHDLVNGAPGGNCPAVDMAATILFEEVIVIVAKEFPVISDDAWDLICVYTSVDPGAEPAHLAYDLCAILRSA